MNNIRNKYDLRTSRASYMLKTKTKLCNISNGSRDEKIENLQVKLFEQIVEMIIAFAAKMWKFWFSATTCGTGSKSADFASSVCVTPGSVSWMACDYECLQLCFVAVQITKIIPEEKAALDALKVCLRMRMRPHHHVMEWRKSFLLFGCVFSNVNNKDTLICVPHWRTQTIFSACQLRFPFNKLPIESPAKANAKSLLAFLFASLSFRLASLPGLSIPFLFCPCTCQCLLFS